MVDIFINVKTTGLDPTTASIWEFAGIIRDGSREETFDYVMRPYNRVVSDEALRMSGKTLQELMSYPSQREAFESFIQLLSKYVDIRDFYSKAQLYGYNSTFSASFLRAWFEYNNYPKFGHYFWHPYGDIMSYAGIVLRKERANISDFKLSTVYSYVTGKPLNTDSVILELRCVVELFDNLLTYGIITRHTVPVRRVASGSTVISW